MKTEYDDQVKEWIPLENGNIMVILQDHKEVDDNGYSKKIISQYCHLGSSIIFHSKRLMNGVTSAVHSFKNSKIYYTYTDSFYIHKKDYNISKIKSLIGRELFQSKNDFSDGGFV